MMRKLILFYTIFIYFWGFSQQTEKLNLRQYKIATLSDSIQETSGLTVLANRLFTINDSGNTPDIFEIKKENYQYVKKYPTTLKNYDWEAITTDGENFFVGEFGNNLGKRKDLKIYQIPFRSDSLIIDSIKTISFYYPEQTDFTPRNINHNFDAEAMVYMNGNIHLFTKEWASNTVSHYRINPNDTENQAAEKLESFDTGFVVTDASYHNNKLYVVGYTKGMQVFLMYFKKSPDSDLFFNQPVKKYFVGMAYQVGQIEGVAATEEGLYVSGERFDIKIKKVPQSLYFIPFKNLE